MFTEGDTMTPLQAAQVLGVSRPTMGHLQVCVASGSWRDRRVQMRGPSVRWRQKGRLLLEDADTLLRFHVADHNNLLNKAAADADLYGPVLEHLGHDPRWEVLVLSTYAPDTSEEQQLHDAWSGRQFVVARVGDLREQDVPIWPTATFIDGVPDPFNHIHFDVVAAVGADLIPPALRPDNRGSKSQRRAARHQLAALIDPVLDLFTDDRQVQ